MPSIFSGEDIWNQKVAQKRALIDQQLQQLQQQDLQRAALAQQAVQAHMQRAAEQQQRLSQKPTAMASLVDPTALATEQAQKAEDRAWELEQRKRTVADWGTKQKDIEAQTADRIAMEAERKGKAKKTADEEVRREKGLGIAGAAVDAFKVANNAMSRQEFASRHPEIHSTLPADADFSKLSDALHQEASLFIAPEQAVSGKYRSEQDEANRLLREKLFMMGDETKRDIAGSAQDVQTGKVRLKTLQEKDIPRAEKALKQAQSKASHFFGSQPSQEEQDAIGAAQRDLTNLKNEMITILNPPSLSRGQTAGSSQAQVQVQTPAAPQKPQAQTPTAPAPAAVQPAAAAPERPASVPSQAAPVAAPVATAAPVQASASSPVQQRRTLVVPEDQVIDTNKWEYAGGAGQQKGGKRLLLLREKAAPVPVQKSTVGAVKRKEGVLPEGMANELINRSMANIDSMNNVGPLATSKPPAVAATTNDLNKAEVKEPDITPAWMNNGLAGLRLFPEGGAAASLFNVAGDNEAQRMARERNAEIARMAGRTILNAMRPVGEKVSGMVRKIGEAPKDSLPQNRYEYSASVPLEVYIQGFMKRYGRAPTGDEIDTAIADGIVL